ncbi:hypothetical protein AJ85_21075 [Alkalihalobacillus alcalophilus ATCC 27647 = CGMCC 1.3604]|uniref:DUF2487 domain-containing protein n=2 Tax=Alkalihalobacillus alcalophilus ATCC 27647 = CGMCC 1.3604 TaxID=1218173 RepID=A0A4S4K2W8_ALKAL|nr:YpiF family protein [Alkalihalobacillus alcalophilus]MED1560475.1 YpiF family protein [Alkalihalobacillus alcalophilus]THG92013.1 hypothetical protein AJ85_21075 [Alkalihalobacillus alcalophilus ATCC 27647 = CGMCC 1.3604]
MIMKWQVKEMDKFLQAKEYVDTAFLPLIPVSGHNQLKTIVSMGEFITIMTNELERQFQGRAVLFPAFTYLKSEKESEREQRLQAWISDLQEGEMKHIFLLTSDAEWKMNEESLNASLIWLPTIPLEHMDLTNKQQVIAEQIKQLVPLLTNKWQNL